MHRKGIQFERALALLNERLNGETPARLFEAITLNFHA